MSATRCELCDTPFSDDYPKTDCDYCDRALCSQCVTKDAPDHHIWMCDACMEEQSPYRGMEKYSDKELLALLDEQETIYGVSILRLLTGRGSRHAEAACIRGLSSGERQIRWTAATALEECGTSRSIPHLIAALDDADHSVRYNATRTLGLLGDPAAIPAIRQRLEDSDERVRKQAARALKLLDPPE